MVCVRGVVCLSGILLWSGLVAGADCNAGVDPEQARARWAARIASMPSNRVLDWALGRQGPPKQASTEARRQKDCLLQALPRGLLPSGFEARAVSAYRGFGRQKAIWLRKYRFQGRPFDRIQAQARALCGTWLGRQERRWKPAKAGHQRCWARLSPAQRQQAILEVSSAPGLSRHHWGTDFDLLDPRLDSRRWQADGPLGPAYTWLHRNAGRYGFTQVYGPLEGRGGRGYQEERWHWSYYPVAQALQDYLKAHQGRFQARLFQLWGDDPAFSDVRRRWRDYVFGISPSQSSSTSSTSR